MSKKMTGYEYHKQFFEMEVTVPTEQEVDEIVKEVLEELKEFHPRSIAGPYSVVMAEVMRRVRDKVSGRFTIKPDWNHSIESSN